MFKAVELGNTLGSKCEEEGEDIKTFDYEGSNIPMKWINGTVYVNLTEIAKAFPSKNLSTVVNSQEIKEYVESLSKLQNFRFIDLLIVKKGAPELGGGTWAHQKVALRVCQKLSTKFAIWVDTKIEELLSTGKTSITREETPEELMARALLVAQKTLEAQEKRYQNLENKAFEMVPKALFADAVTGSKGLISIEVLAKILHQNGFDLGRNRLFEWMRQHKYLGSSGNSYNIPTQSAIDLGLFEVQIKTIHNHPFILKVPLVTGKGQVYFVNKFLEERKVLEEAIFNKGNNKENNKENNK